MVQARCYIVSFVGIVEAGCWSMGYVLCTVSSSTYRCANKKKAKAGDNIYIFYGTFDKPSDLPPKGEFFCKVRDPWMPEIQGKGLHYDRTCC